MHASCCANHATNYALLCIGIPYLYLTANHFVTGFWKEQLKQKFRNGRRYKKRKKKKATPTQTSTPTPPQEKMPWVGSKGVCVIVCIRAFVCACILVCVYVCVCVSVNAHFMIAC